MFDPSMLDDPRKVGLLLAAARMLQPGPGGFAGALSQAVPAGLMGYQSIKGANDRRAEEEQQRQFRSRQLAEMDRQTQNQGLMAQAFKSAFAPNQNLVSRDDDGNAMPSSGGGGAQQFAMDVGKFDPMLAMQMMPKPQGPMVLKEGEAAFDPSGQRLFGNPRVEKSEPLYGKINPSEYTEASLRKFAQTRNHADLVPYRKPEAGPKPEAPRLYDGPDGPVWVTPPSAGQPGQTLPVTDPSGNPIAAKKRNQPLTESQAKGTLFLGQMRGAEEAIGKLKFKPETTTAQTHLALALKAQEEPGMIKGAAMNMLAGKDAQQYAQAAEQWSEAFLRIKTGAAATREEVIRNIRTFFPQPGDTPAKIKQKNAARADANKQMEIIAGSGVQQLDAQRESKVVDWNDLP